MSHQQHLSASGAGSRLSVQRLSMMQQKPNEQNGNVDDHAAKPAFDGAASSPGSMRVANKSPGPVRPAPNVPPMQRQLSSKIDLSNKTPPPQPPAFRNNGPLPGPSTNGGAPPSIPPFKKEDGPASNGPSQGTGSPMHAAFLSRPPPAPSATTNPATTPPASGGGGPPPVPTFKRPDAGAPGSPTGVGGVVHAAFLSKPPPAFNSSTTSTTPPTSSPATSSPGVAHRNPAFSAPPPPRPVDLEEPVSSPSQIMRDKPPPPPISEFRSSGLSNEEDEWEDDVFAEADSEDNLRFEPETENTPKPIVRAGTLEKLVQRLTFEKYPDPDYLQAFLLTYRSFTTPPELLALLIQRWDVPPPKGANETQLAEFSKTILEPVRLRVFNVLNKWVLSHFYDFAEDRSLVDTILDFISDKMMATKETAALQLKRIVYRKLEGNETENEVQFGQVAPKPILPIVTGTTFTLLDIDPVEVARQLTLIEYSLYKSIMPRECLGQAWTKPTRHEKAPNIMAMISRFNAVSRFFATEIVKEQNMRKRADILNHIINVAVGCEKLNNYNAMMEIVSSLQCSSIYRLRHTWGLLPKATVKAYENIQALMSREKNFKVFREHLHSVDPPCIPYLGVYLTDLTFIEDANQDYFSDSQKLINFDKRRKISHVIREIQQYQQTPYCLENAPTIRDYLLNSEFWGENETFDASLKLEPKGMPAPTVKRKDMIAAQAAARFKSFKMGKEPKSERKENTGSQVIPRTESAPTPTPVEEEEDWGELDKAEGYKFGEPDSKENIQFDIDVSALVGVDSTARPSIRAATLPKLIERLTHENWPDPALVNTFLLTYTTFTTRKEVLDLLAMRFNVPVPVNKDKELQERYNQSKSTPIRLRVFNVLKNWSGDRYFHDCVGDPQFLSEFSQLADTMASVGMDKPATAIKRALQRQIDGIPENVERRTVGKAPKPYLPKNLSGQPLLTDFHPEEVARQLTLIEHLLFQQVKPWELLRNGWMAPTADKLAPNIIAIQKRVDRIRDWVATEIVSQDSPEDAAAIITHWIKIAEKCLNINNFHTTVEIITGLLLPDIQKLKLVWGSVSSRNTFNKLKSFVQDSDYAKLQDKLHNVQPPCLPFMGAYLYQISDLEAKHPDSLDGLINFEKWTLIGGVISEVNQYQNTLYCLEEVPFLQDWINKVDILSPTRINEESITLLTRAPKSKAKKPAATFAPIAENGSSTPRRDSVDGNEPEDFPTGTLRQPVRAPSRMKISKLLGTDDKTIEQQSRSSFSGSARTSVSSIDSGRASSGGGSSELGIDKVKFQVMSMFFEDSEFRQSIADLLLKDLRDSLSTLHSDIQDIKRAIPASNASPATGRAPTKEIAARDVICGHFPGRSLSVWTREDKEGFVYGWDETVTLYTVSEGNSVVLADVRPTVTKADMASLLRLAKFYSKETGRSPDPKIYVFSSAIHDDARAVAAKCASALEFVSI